MFRCKKLIESAQTTNYTSVLTVRRRSKRIRTTTLPYREAPCDVGTVCMTISQH
jgi:hypothetical protein